MPMLASVVWVKTLTVPLVGRASEKSSWTLTDAEPKPPPPPPPNPAVPNARESS